MSFFVLVSADIKKILQLLKLNLKSRYMGSKIGLAWAILNPLLLVLIYTFIFGFVLKSKVPGSEQSLDYVTWFICGFAPWMAISEGVNSGAMAVVHNAQLIKNFSIKAELYPIVGSLMGIPQLLVGLVVILVLSFVTGVGVSLQLLWLLLIIPLLFAFLSSIAFFLSALTVFIRDLAQIISTVLLFLLFFSPVFYSVDQLPSIVQRITFFNPIHQICSPFRAVLLQKSMPDLWGLLYLLALTIILWFLGLHFFRRLKGYFESAI